MPNSSSPKPPKRAVAIAADLVDETQTKAQICYRLSRDKRDMLHRIALDRRSNVQSILDEAVGDWLSKNHVDL